VFGALHVTRFCEEHGVRSLVFTSSISVYGPSEEAKSEASLPAPVSAYGKSKLQAEHPRDVAARRRDRRLAVARLAVIFGPAKAELHAARPGLGDEHVSVSGRKDTIKGCAYVGEVIRTFGSRWNARAAVHIQRRLPEPYTLERSARHSMRWGPPEAEGTLPTSVMKAGVLPFEVLSAIGIRNPICRARVDKLVHSTYIVPGRLLADGYSFETDLDEALRAGLRRRRPAGSSKRVPPASRKEILRSASVPLQRLNTRRGACKTGDPGSPESIVRTAARIILVGPRIHDLHDAANLTRRLIAFYGLPPATMSCGNQFASRLSVPRNLRYGGWEP